MEDGNCIACASFQDWNVWKDVIKRIFNGVLIGFCLTLDMAPPRPPLPAVDGPMRPPLPAETDDEDAEVFKPNSSHPIMVRCEKINKTSNTPSIFD